jgi:hypothetical protein
MVTRASACSLVTARYSASNVASQAWSRAIRQAVRRDTRSEQPHLHLGETLVVLERHLLSEVTLTHLLEKQRERLGANQVRSDDLMRRVDLHAIADEVQQGRRVDHITSHLGTLGGPTPSL